MSTLEGERRAPSFPRRSRLTIEINELTGDVKGDYSHVHKLSMDILTLLGQESIGYSQMACALTLARLENPNERLPIEKETTFVGDLMEWLGAYFANVGEGH